MTAKIPASVREQQINEKPDIEFVRWDGGYKGVRSKAVCRCLIDGYEWPASVNSLVSKNTGCPQCAGNRIRTASERIAQINERPNIQFVRWEGGYKNSRSKAVCRCSIDGYEWSAEVQNLARLGTGCPQCARTKRWTEDERIAQINEKPNIEFVRWEGEYKTKRSKAVCRCLIDGYEWSTEVQNLVRLGTGCPQCAGKRRWTASERIAQINERPDIEFVRWESEYKNNLSRAVCRCQIDGCEWAVSVNHLVSHNSGCPACAKSGYDPSKPGTLYALRSECGSMVKIGISNDHRRRHRELAATTPFEWRCIELVHGEGAKIAELEQELLGKTEPIDFGEQFDGYTEWRKWDARIPEWFRAVSA